MTKMANNTTLKGKSDVERGIVFSDWLKQLNDATTFDNAISILYDIYNCGYRDGYSLGAGDNSWDK